MSEQVPMHGMGHNNGPTMEPGAGFRKLAWTKARSALLPTLPLQVVRLRVKRAERLGIPYKTYATIRAVSGRDIVAFLFSDNAFRLDAENQAPAPVAQRLIALRQEAACGAAVYAPRRPEHVQSRLALDAAGRAPTVMQTWSVAREQLRLIAKATGAPMDGTVVVADSPLEADWASTGGLAGTVMSKTLFDYKHLAET